MKIGDGSLFVPTPRLNIFLILRELARSSLTQAELARRCHLSVAMVNNYMKRLLGEGLINYNRKNTRIVLYTVTRQGQKLAGTIQVELEREVCELLERYGTSSQAVRP